MKLHKKALLIPTCLTLLTASSQAALVLEFREVGEDRVELSFSGFVNLDDPRVIFSENEWPSVSGGHDILSTISLGFTIDSAPTVDVFNIERISGDNLLTGDLASSSFRSDTRSIGFNFLGNEIVVSDLLISGLSGNNSVQDVSVLSGEVGGVLYGKSQQWNTTFAASGLDRHVGKGRVDLWKVTGSADDDHLIQFHVIPTPVPEPSSILLTGIGLLTLTVRRKRNEHTCKSGRNET